jgi:hypothetical protein
MLRDDGQRLYMAPAIIFLPKLLGFLLVLLALPFFAWGQSQAAKEDVLFREGFLEMVSPDSLSIDQCRRVAEMTMAAWNFDLEQMNWSSSINMNSPLTLRVLSIERMKTEHPGVLGFAKAGGNLLIVSTAVLSDSLAKGTLAHELGHIQAFRALGRNTSLKVPHYFLEGHGLNMGRAYRDHLGVGKTKYDADNARIVAKLTASEARLIITTDVDYYRGDRYKERVMGAFGVFFVEYLRVRRGMPDAVARMGRVFELVGGGNTYEHAFKQTYGISVSQAVSEITSFMERTQSSPVERLKGTLYEQNISTKR